MALIGTMDSGVSALRTFEQGLEVIGNNIANVSTNAFKGSDAHYADSFSNILDGSTASGAVTQIGTGVQLAGVSTNFSQGQVTTTGVPSDVAVSGSGFFIVKNPTSGASFATRDGAFTIDANGYLVDSQGDRVQGLTGGSASGPPTTVGDIKLGTPPANTQLQSFAIDTSGNFVETYSDGSTATTNALLLQNYSNPNVQAHYDVTVDGGQVASLLRNPSIPAGTIQTSGSIEYQQVANRTVIQALVVRGDVASRRLDHQDVLA